MRPRPSYDDAAAIQDLLSKLGLEGLHLLARERRNVFQGGGQLHPFLLYGAWLANSAGEMRLVRVGDSPFKATFPADLPECQQRLPQVLAWDNFLAFYQSLQASCILSRVEALPPVHLLCPECGIGWGAENAHDFEGGLEMLKPQRLPNLAGRTLAEIRDLFARRTDAIWSLYLGKEELDVFAQPNHFFQLGHRELRHRACARAKRYREQHAEFTQLCAAAGFDFAALRPLPDHYSDAGYPWFSVTTEVGEFVLGWRSQVIVIDWALLGRTFRALFNDQDVTKDDRSIHAWGLDMAALYLQRIRVQLQNEPVLV